MRSWAATHIGIPLYELLSGRRPWREVHRLRELQWRPRAELEALALARLRPLLEHAEHHVPHYRALFARAGIRPADIGMLADLSRVPTTSKADLRAGFPDRVIADNLPASRRFRTQTSGSTGLPFEFYTDRADVDRRLGSFLLFWEWAGVPAGDRVAHVVVSLRPAASVASVSRWARVARRTLMGQPTVHLSGLSATGAELLAALRELSRGSDYLLWGLPSAIGRLAVELADAGELPTPPRVVIASGETLTAVDAAAIGRTFRCPLVNHYSSYEVLHLAQTCPDNPELIHVDSERAILRVAREDGTPAAPGESGRLVITDLGNWVMPFINYDIGDRGQVGPPCPCGRGFPTLRGLEGRLGEAIRTPGGKLVSPLVLGWFLIHVCDALPHIWEFQAIQVASDAVTLRVVPTPRFTSEVARALGRELEAFLGPGVRVTVETADRIETEASGKRLVIRSALTPS
jgi:phenylacetate-CoA ligase